jgi:hypothetical protein
VIPVVIAVAIALLLTYTYIIAQGVKPPSPLGTAPLELQFSGPPCPGWSNESVPIGMVITGGPVTTSVPLFNRAPSGSCTAESVSTPTVGFTLLSSNTPVTVNAGTFGPLNVTVQTPSTMPLGNVTFVVYVEAVTAVAIAR